LVGLLWAYLVRESFQGLLLRHRGRTGLTQRQLAARVGVSRASIQDWETGLKYPDVHHLQALVAAFLESGGMTEGAEQSEAESLWDTATREARRVHAPFDGAWWAAMMARHSVAAPYQAFPRIAVAERRQDWGEAPALMNVHGRADELDLLREWSLVQHCRLLAILGIGGIGKTTLGVRVAQDLAPHFSRVYWRTLRDALPLADWLTGAIAFLSDNQIRPPHNEAAQRSLLLQLLQQWPSLLVLDNFDTLLEPGRHDGRYRDGYAGYGRLLQTIADGRHRSCLLVTSREAPPELTALAGDAVRALYLAGLGVEEVRSVLAEKHLVGTRQDWTRLTERFAGNGLALKIVGESIHEVFGDSIRAFLDASGPGVLFGDVLRLLDSQLQRSSGLEQHLLRVFAVEREPMTIGALLEQLAPRLGHGAVLEALEALRRRSLLEHVDANPEAGFRLQSVVLEYVTDYLVRAVSEEIAQQQPSVLLEQPLINAQASEYIRQTQERLIGEPTVQRLVVSLGHGGAEQRLLSLLNRWRTQTSDEQAFGPGNAVNLLRLLRGDLNGMDLSGIEIRQANLAGVDAHETSLAGSHLDQPMLAEAFTHPAALALSDTGEWLVAGTATGQIYVWRLADRARLLALDAHTSTIHGLVVNWSRQLLASGGDDGLIRLFDLRSGAMLRTVRAHVGPVYDLALARDGEVLVSGGADGAVRLWNLSMVRQTRAGEGHSGAVYGVAVSADGHLVASAGEDGTIRLWDANAKSIGVLAGDANRVYSVSLSADGRVLCSGGVDGRVRVWRVPDRNLLATFDAHAGAVWRVALSPDGKLLVSGGWDGTFAVCELPAESGAARVLSPTPTGAGAVYTVAMSANKRVVANASEDGAIRLWESASGRLLFKLQGDTAAIRALAISRDGGLLVSGGFDGSVRLWDPSSGACIGRLRGHTGQVSALALSSDARVLATAGLDGTLVLWDVASGRPLRSFKVHAGAVYGLALSSDGRTLASCGLDATIRLWNPVTGRMLTQLDGHTRGVWAVAISRDGRFVGSGGFDGTARVWSTSGDRPSLVLPQPDGPVLSVATDAEGQIFVSGGEHGRIVVWDARSGRIIREIQAHSGPVFSLAMDASGRVLASAGLDATVRLWGLSGGESLGVLRGHAGSIYSVCMDASRDVLASGGLDGTIRIWHPHGADAPLLLRAERRYEGMNITDVSGITPEQHAALVALGAVERDLSAQGSGPATEMLPLTQQSAHASAADGSTVRDESGK
jgi:WD40 repeat protein/transcriptional regulator with XRE-family HTH domain